MKLLHIADLHIGKRVGGLSMIEEQKNVIAQLEALAKTEDIEAVLIAGDVFDRPVPSHEALETCESLFSAFCENGIDVFVIPGNHDSSQQLAFCSHLLAPSGLHIAKAFDGHIETHTLDDGKDRVCIHLLPFIRPTDVRMALAEKADEISTHEDAVSAALSQDKIDEAAFNILVAHQFVTSGDERPETSDSEIMSVGGSDNVDASLFDAYDYVALGHLHRAQHIGRPHIRYAGSPLKYSFSETQHEKSATLLEISAGSLEVKTHPLKPLHDMREIKASYEELRQGIDTKSNEDYMRVTLTDSSLADAMAKLRAIYPNILRLDWEGFAEPVQHEAQGSGRTENVSPIELFEEYYEKQTSSKLDQTELRAVKASFDADGAVK